MPDEAGLLLHKYSANKKAPADAGALQMKILYKT
jgi:hypothetical protein